MVVVVVVVVVVEVDTFVMLVEGRFVAEPGS